MAVWQHGPVRVRSGEDHGRGPRPSGPCVPWGSPLCTACGGAERMLTLPTESEKATNSSPAGVDCIVPFL